MTQCHATCPAPGHGHYCDKPHDRKKPHSEHECGEICGCTWDDHGTVVTKGEYRPIKSESQAWLQSLVTAATQDAGPDISLDG